MLRRGRVVSRPGDLFDLNSTFENGQIFGWRSVLPSDGPSCWRGVIDSQIVSLRQPAATSGATSALASGSVAAAPSDVDSLIAAVDYELHDGSSFSSSSSHHSELALSATTGSADASASSAGEQAHDPAGTHSLTSFLQSDVSMRSLCASWAKADSRLATIADSLPGMRILRQDPWECLISFICSSNNNIARIGQMLAKLRARFGAPIAALDGQMFYAFPSPAALAAASEEELRGLGMGYRAKYLRQTAAAVVGRGGAPYLLGLRGKPTTEVQAALMAFSGVGPKVADCVALFSCDAADAVPVDTHVWAIACCYYDRSLTMAASMTPTIYSRVGELFRSRFGSHAGWAHSLLFAAELPVFRSRLPPVLRVEMEAFRVEEAAGKAVKRAAAAARKAAKQALGVGAGAGAAGSASSAAAGAESSTSADTVGDEGEEADTCCDVTATATGTASAQAPGCDAAVRSSNAASLAAADADLCCEAAGGGRGSAASPIEFADSCGAPAQGVVLSAAIVDEASTAPKRRRGRSSASRSAERQGSAEAAGAVGAAALAAPAVVLESDGSLRSLASAVGSKRKRNSP
jgi:N-glycosylase/DNA lyase